MKMFDTTARRCRPMHVLAREVGGEVMEEAVNISLRNDSSATALRRRDLVIRSM